MFIDKYLNSVYLDIFYNNYNLSYIRSFDEASFLKIYNLLREKGFYFIDDIILNYFEIFELDEISLRKALIFLEGVYGTDYVSIIGKNMTLLDKVIELASNYGMEDYE